MDQLPWLLEPFVVGTFVLVQALSTAGWIERVSYIFEQILNMSTVPSTLSIGIISLVSMAVSNSQAATIFLSRALIPLISVFALVSAINYGALLSLNDALAGLMWVKMIHGHGVEMTY